MGKGYIVVTYRSIKNQDKWKAYAALAAPAIQKAGGKFIVRGMPMGVHELGVKERVVIVEFDSVHKATAAHDTPAYQEALKALGDGAERDFRIVEGVIPAQAGTPFGDWIPAFAGMTIKIGL